jgi:REP element-mobilizing transposase RayT
MNTIKSEIKTDKDVNIHILTKENGQYLTQEELELYKEKVRKTAEQNKMIIDQ